MEIKKYALLLVLCILTGCAATGTSLLNASVTKDTYIKTPDIAYGSAERQKLDIYVPKTKEDHRPVVIFIHGGSWQWGNKSDYAFIGQALTSEGFVTVVPNYTLYPEAVYPEFLKDNAKAFAWVEKHIAEFGGDKSKIFVMGHSAGAYNAVSLAVNPVYLKEAGTSDKAIHGVIGLAGPYDFLPIKDDHLKKIFAQPDMNKTQPISYITSKLPPMMLAAGIDDDIVDPGNTLRMARALKKQGNEVEEIYYKNVEHLGIVVALAEPFRTKAPVLKDTAAFIRKHP